MKENKHLGFLTALAILFACAGGASFKMPGIGYKILGVVFLLLSTISAYAVLHLLGFHD